MSKKEAIYILIALAAVSTVWFLIVEPGKEDECGCDGET